MKEIAKKGISILIVIAVLVSAMMVFSGCEVPADDDYTFDENPDEAKTQLYVGYYNGGLGLKWLTVAKELFEAKYPDYQIMIDTGKEEYDQEVLFSNIKTNRQDMYLTDSTPYYKFVKSGYFCDITEEMTKPLTEFGEGRSIEDKLNVSLKDFYKTGDGKYYAAPYYQSYHHITYDVDLFDKYNLWFKDGGGFVNSTEDKKSAGQDGEYGTWDDGLPVSYSDFFLMMDRMVARGITPITWSGQYASAYLFHFLHSFIADYEGENFRTNFNYDGSEVVITNKDFIEPEPKTFSLDPKDLETVTITSDNFDEYMYSTAGRYFAIKFAKDLASNSRYRTYNYAESHTGVQRSFLMSSMDGVNKPIAMLIEGGWWINESTSVFNEMSEIDQKYSKENRRFGIMPIPKADDGTSAPGHTVAPFSGDSAVFISAFSPKQDIAKLFFRFLHTDEVLQAFTEYSGVMRPYEYDLSPIYDGLTYYTKTMIDMSKDTTFIYKLPTGEKYKEDELAAGFMADGGLLCTQVDETSDDHPIIFFCDHPEYSSKDYFLGLRVKFLSLASTNIKK